MKEREIVKGNMGRREWGIKVENMWGRRERDSENMWEGEREIVRICGKERVEYGNGGE